MNAWHFKIFKVWFHWPPVEQQGKQGAINETMLGLEGQLPQKVCLNRQPVTVPIAFFLQCSAALSHLLTLSGGEKNDLENV